LVCVENETHPLQCPMRNVLDLVCVENETHPLQRPMRSVLVSYLQLEPVSLYGDDLHHGDLLDELLGPLGDQVHVLAVPAGTLQVQPNKNGFVLTGRSSLGDVICMRILGHGGVESGLVQGPAVLAASGLHQRREVRLWDVQAGQPD
ncbi:hypothetical protein EGW08_014921, partial [Elysia chlorotica]